jgi:hypothetical protein
MDSFKGVPLQFFPINSVMDRYTHGLHDFVDPTAFDALFSHPPHPVPDMPCGKRL